MRKVIFAINMSIDGCCDHTQFRPDDELMAYFTQLVRDADTFVYGRKTYQLMVPYWPDIARDLSGDEAENAYALAFDAVSKIIVVSHSLDRVEGKKTHIINTNLKDEILKMKQEDGKHILIGGITLLLQLVELGLVDEFRFVIHPIVVGEGRRLFEGINLPQKLQLKLAESTVFKSGAVALRYVKG